MAGYSGTPLWKKLGIKPGYRIYVENMPENYRALLDPLPAGVVITQRLSGQYQLMQLFGCARDGLRDKLAHCRDQIVPEGMIWVSWPKKTAKIATDVTEDVIRAAALPLGLVDTKVCAVDAVWSALKLVIRRANRVH